MIAREEQDQLFINAVAAVGALMEAALNDMPPATRQKIALSLTHGGELTVMCSLLGAPRFVGMLLKGPNADPIKLFEIVPASEPAPMMGH